MNITLARLFDKRLSDVLDFPKVENLGIEYLCSSLRSRSYQTEIIDEEIQDISREEIIERIKKSDLVGFTATAKSQIYEVIKVANTVKGDVSHITVGGHFPTYLYKGLLNHTDAFDSVVLYEGEETLVQLAKTISQGGNLDQVRGLAYKRKGEIVTTSLRPLIENLDNLPFPSRDLMPSIVERGGLPVVSSSRGCYNRCSYCSISSFYGDAPGKNFRLRSPENVARELNELKADFPEIKDIWFVDDNFVYRGKGGFERTEKLCAEIKSLDLKFDIYLRADDVNEKTLKLLKDSGLRSIFIGAESGCDRTLEDILNKRTTVEKTKKAIRLSNEFGVSVEPGFIMFHPWSTIEEIGENINFLKEVGSYTPYGILSFLTTFRFTPIGRQMLSGERSYKRSPVVDDDPLQDDVPYEVQDSNAELLLNLSLKAFQEFHDLPKTLSQMRNTAKREGNSKLSEAYSRELRSFGDAAMFYFEKLYGRVQRGELRGIRDYFDRVCRDIRSYVDEHVSNIESLLLS